MEKWNHVMRTGLCLAMLLIPTIAFAQGPTPAKRPTVGAKPLVQVMPRALTHAHLTVASGSHLQLTRLTMLRAEIRLAAKPVGVCFSE